MSVKKASHRPTVAIFDLGGVLIDWNPRHLYRKLIPQAAEMEEFLAQVTTGKWHGAQDRGGDPDQATRELQALHPGKEALIAAFYSRFDEMCDHAFAPMAELVERLHHAGTPMILLSNAPALMDTWLRGPAHARHPFLGRFREYVVSGLVGCSKPDAAIYTLACQTGGFTPRDAVFVDDALANVEGARAIGMNAIHHRNADDTVSQLRDLGFPA